jgi:hypothetical protein
MYSVTPIPSLYQTKFPNISLSRGFYMFVLFVYLPGPAGRPARKLCRSALLVVKTPRGSKLCGQEWRVRGAERDSTLVLRFYPEAYSQSLKSDFHSG